MMKYFKIQKIVKTKNKIFVNPKKNVRGNLQRGKKFQENSVIPYAVELKIV